MKKHKILPDQSGQTSTFFSHIHFLLPSRLKAKPSRYLPPFTSLLLFPFMIHPIKERAIPPPKKMLNFHVTRGSTLTTIEGWGYNRAHLKQICASPAEVIEPVSGLSATVCEVKSADGQGSEQTSTGSFRNKMFWWRAAAKCPGEPVEPNSEGLLRVSLTVDFSSQIWFELLHLQAPHTGKLYASAPTGRRGELSRHERWNERCNQVAFWEV